MRRPVLAITLLCLLCPSPAGAQDYEDGQVWIQALALGRLSENWRSHLEVQPRWFDDASSLGLVIVRGAVGRRLTRQLTGLAGYGWVPRTSDSGVRHEQRIWQQLSLALPPASGWTVSGRLRLEQRWLEPWEDTSNRMRVLARAQRPLGSSRWSVVFYNEVMLTLDDTGSGPEQGFDRNRLHAGVMRRLAPAVTAEAGYLWEHTAVSPDGSRDEHVAIANITLQFPR